MPTTSNDLLGTLIPEWKSLLQGWALDGSLVAAAQEALLLSGTPPALQDLISQWGSGDFRSLPPIVLLPSADISGAMGANAISTGTIYLNADWLAGATRDQVFAVLTEELGHHLDGVLNAVDTPGDEGEYFARLLFVGDLTNSDKQGLASQNDGGVATIGGSLIVVEQATASASDTVPPVITGLTLGSTTLNPAQQGGAYLSATLDFSDNLSGISEASLNFCSTTSSQILTIYLSEYSSLTSGNALTGRLSGSRPLPPAAHGISIVLISTTRRGTMLT
jgi:hypothetical protein